MVSAHIWLHPYGRKATGEGGAHQVRYLQRLAEFDPVHYLQRTDGKERDYTDLVCGGHQNLPRWSGNDPQQFFRAAKEHEGVNRYYAFQVEFSLPRELTHEQHMALREDLMQALMPDLPALWVKHDKELPGGERHPHIHILFSARKQDGIERGERQTFRRWDRAQPGRGGCEKAVFWSKRQAPEQVRHAFADITNYHLERAGAVERIDVRSLWRQGIDREPIRGENPVRPDAATREREQEQARAAWEQRKAYTELGDIMDLSREALVARVYEELRTARPGRQIERASLEVVRDWHVREGQRLEHALQGIERAQFTVGQRRMVARYRHTGESPPVASRPAVGVERERGQVPRRALDPVELPAVGEDRPYGRAVRTRIFDRERERDGR